MAVLFDQAVQQYAQAVIAEYCAGDSLVTDMAYIGYDQSTLLNPQMYYLNFEIRCEFDLSAIGAKEEFLSRQVGTVEHGLVQQDRRGMDYAVLVSLWTWQHKPQGATIHHLVVAVQEREIFEKAMVPYVPE